MTTEKTKEAIRETTRARALDIGMAGKRFVHSVENFARAGRIALA